MYGERIDLEGLAISIVLARIWIAFGLLVLVTWVAAWLVSLWRHHRAGAPDARALASRRRLHGRRSVHQGGA